MKKIFFISALSFAVIFANAQKMESAPMKASPEASSIQEVKTAKIKMAEVSKDDSAKKMEEMKAASSSMAANATQVKLVETLSVKETEFDFGKIPQGKPVTHVFMVSNTGTTPFKLENVQASCGCTTPVWDKEKTIEAGKTSEITVGYNAAAEGVFTKSITITYNGTQTKVIQIKGEVWKTPTTSAPTNAAANDLKN